MQWKGILLTILVHCSLFGDMSKSWTIGASLSHLHVPLIVIDPGHGGKDAGTHSFTPPKYEEKSLALKTAMMLRTHLRNMGYRTILTRSCDEFIELQRRAEIANEAKATAFVSIHYNAAGKESVHGVEVFYYLSKDSEKRTEASKKMAENTLHGVLKMTKAHSRGVKHGNFVVIRETKMPAILVECGFLTNTEERAKLYEPSYQRKVVWGIAQGIDASIRKNKALSPARFERATYCLGGNRSIP